MANDRNECDFLHFDHPEKFDSEFQRDKEIEMASEDDKNNDWDNDQYYQTNGSSSDIYPLFDKDSLQYSEFESTCFMLGDEMWDFLHQTNNEQLKKDSRW